MRNLLTTLLTLYMKTITTILLLLVLASCGKEKYPTEVTPITSDCLELGTPPLNDWNYLIDPNYYTYPCFNPNNSNEIIFTHRNYGSGQTILYRYNLTTKEKSFIYEGVQIFAPRWGSNDWILMNLSDRNIWKIKSDGTNLTQLTDSGNDFYPTWNSNATCFAAFRGSFNDNLQKTILYTPEAIPFDTLEDSGVSASTNWSISGVACSVSPNNISVANLNLDTLLFLYNGEFNHIGGCHWISNEEFLWSFEEGIFKTNYITSSTELVKASCRTRSYQSPTFHPNANKIIWTRVELKQLNSQDILVTSRLFIMNPDGSEEVEIIIE